MTFPANDDAFEDKRIEAVRSELSGWSISVDAWSFWVPKESPVEPEVGMQARFYGKGIGYPVRGLYLNGREVFYRTEAEHTAYEREQRYGKDARDLIRKWDAGDIIWSLSMGGFGPGYEQALQVAAVEFTREGLDIPIAGDREKFYREGWDEVCHNAIKRIGAWGGGLSGAQYAAAKWLAWQWVHNGGPAELMDATKKRGEEDRQIQVSKSFAHSSPLTAAAQDLLEALVALERYADGIVCYASTMGEHEPNRIVVQARAAIAKANARRA